MKMQLSLRSLFSSHFPSFISSSLHHCTRNIHTFNRLMFLLGPQPSSSCSFDGSLKSESSDSEPRWPEIPPVLNQNEDRRRNKYLRKDYLKVIGTRAHLQISLSDAYIQYVILVITYARSSRVILTHIHRETHRYIFADVFTQRFLQQIREFTSCTFIRHVFTFY